VDSDAERRARAEARRERATLRKTSLRAADDPCPLRGEEAVSLVAQLTRESWAASGRPMPTYARGESPVRFVPGRER
jgi:hypothetical protein